MQNRTIKEMLKATIISIIVAFFIVILISSIAIKFGKEKFLMATSFVDMITIPVQASENQISPVLQEYEEDNVEKEQKMILTNCPDFGTNYATLKIESIGIELPIYYGKSLDLLKKGIGHDNDSYFPGEGGSIVLMGHNFNKFLANLPKAKIGDKIKITTNYGEFNYTIYNSQIVEETETEKVPIQEKEEILMIYTCWPINNIGYTTQRYVVYAK